MRYTIRLLAAILAGALAAPVLMGCSLPTGGSASEPKSSAAAGNVTSGGEPRPTAPALDFNPLTGLYDMEKGDSFRPLAAMIGNNDRSRPQFGLEKADLYVEAETEGGITRIMAVFANASRVPEQLGPIRSARTPFVLLAQSLDAIYAHCGGSVNGLKAIKERKIQDIEGLIYDGSTYWRDAELRKTKGAEYSMMTSGELLEKRIAAKEYPSETSRGAPYVFGEREGRLRRRQPGHLYFQAAEDQLPVRAGGTAVLQIQRHVGGGRTPRHDQRRAACGDESVSL